MDDGWYYPSHVIGSGQIVDGDSEVVPVVCEDGRILAKGDRHVWCDVREVMSKRADVVVDLLRGSIDEICWDVCGTHLRPGTWRTAWADDVSVLDLEEPIWRIGLYSVPGPRREYPVNNATYWIGVGECLACPAGSVAVHASENETLLYACGGCKRCWVDRAFLSETDALEMRVNSQLRFATADQVAADWNARFQQLLSQERRDALTLDAMINERWAIRLRR